MNDVFISYAHIDNESLTEGQKGWISQFHRTLEVRLRQLMGENPKVWRDQKLMGNDVFDETLVDQFSTARVMVSVVSPRYVKSEWCQREALEFHDAADLLSVHFDHVTEAQAASDASHPAVGFLAVDALDACRHGLVDGPRLALPRLVVSRGTRQAERGAELGERDGMARHK